MGLHEPDYVNGPEIEYPAYLCFDCGHSWVPEEGRLEPAEGGGWVWSPDETDCPICGSEETDGR